MKTFVLASTIAFALMSGEAVATCSSGTPLTNTQLLSLAGKTVCVPNGTGGWEWQEFHSGGPSSGPLIDWKLGISTMDPTETVGNWSISGTTITHAYAGGGSFSYSVVNNGDGTRSFCPSSPEIVATIRSGQGSCNTLVPIP